MHSDHSKKDIKIVFFGTPALVVPILDALAAARMRPGLVVTAPDRPVGRKQTVTPPPVKVWALAQHVPVLQPEKLDEAFLASLDAYAPDISIVVAYGKILPQGVIDVPKHGTFNIHYSLLPKYRGAAPVEAAILSGDTETGISIQKMVFKLDAGPVVFKTSVAIDDHIPNPDLRTLLTTVAAAHIVEVIHNIISGAVTYTEQDETQVSFAPKIKKEDGEINLTDDGTLNWRKYRAYYGWPGTFFFADHDGKKIRVLIKEAVYRDGIFTPKRVLPEGELEMDYLDFRSRK